MKNVIKKMLSLLLVGVVTVSMFGFVAPPVEAAKANIYRTDKITIESFVKHAEKIKVTTSCSGNFKKKTYTVNPPKGIFSNQCSFKVKEPLNQISITFCIYDPCKRKTKWLIKAEFFRLSSCRLVEENPNSVFIIIDENGNLNTNCYNRWQLKSSSYESTDQL